MDVTEVVLGGLVQRCLQTRLLKHPGKNFELLKLQSGFLIYKRDAVKEEKIKELLSGKKPIECKIWLERVEEIERQVKAIFSEYEEKRSRRGVFFHMQQRGRMKKMLSKIDDQLKNFPIEHDLMVDAPHKITRRMDSLKSQVDLYGPERKTEMENSQRKAGTKATATGEPGTSPTWGKKTAQRKEMLQRKDVETLVAQSTGASVQVGKCVAQSEKIVAPSTGASVQVLEDKKKYGFEAAEAEVMPMQTSETETVSVPEVKGKTIFGISGKCVAQSEIIPASAQKSLMVPDLVPPARTEAEVEHEIIPLPGAKISAMHETGIQLIPTESEGLFSFHDTKSIEIVPDVTEGMFASHARRIELVPSETEREYRMKPELRSNIKKSVEPLVPVAISSSDPSKKAAVNLEILPSSNKKDENPPINKAKVEAHCQTVGGQVLTEPIVNARRSISHIVQKILGYMRDVKARRISIFGNGGIGKTTVLKVLINHLETKNMFDLILWVTVSRYSGTKQIQNQVVRQLSGCLPGFETNHENILHALKNKKFLLLLDDVWEWIDLDAVGIPNPGQENGSRIIMATRSPDVSRIMAADREIEVELVSSEEAWILFHEKVGVNIDSPDIQPYARAIVEECGGLPLTIVVTGRALRNETDVLVWKRALGEFLLPSTRGMHGIEAVIQRLKFSYDKLKARDIKNCFLYCALLPEDHGVNISELINYFIDEGLVVGNLTDAHKKGHDIIELLVEAYLLETAEGGLSVRMHDTIRDLAFWIISPEAEGCQFLLRAESRLTQPPKLELKEGKIFLESSSLTSRPKSPKRTEFLFPDCHRFLSRAGAGLTEPPSMEEWEQAQMVFLMDNGLSSLPESPNCRNLLTLFLQRNDHLRVIPMSFFNCMPCLQVLNLSKTRIKSLPQSLFNLINLQVLVLRDCKRLAMLPSKIGTLEHLEVLDLQGTEIYNLPNEIGNLACLKHFLVSFYGSVNRSEYVKLPPELVSHGIISRLITLKELCIVVYPGDQRWNRDVKLVTVELSNLTELTTLEFYFPDVDLLELFIQTSPSWNGKGLTKFNFVVGQNVKRIMSRVPVDVEFEYGQHDHCLRFVNSSETLPPPAVVEVLTRSTALYLDHHLRICSLTEFGISNLNALEFCILRECPEIQIVVDGGELDRSALPFLEHLSIHYLRNLKRIWKGPVPTGSLSRLKFLSIHTCPELTFVLTCSMLQILSNLEVLVVEDCQAVEHIIEDTFIDSGDIVLPKLKKLRLHYVPKLVSIWKGPWPSVEHISFYNCPDLINLHIHFDVVDTIKEIKAETDWWNELKWEENGLSEQLKACFTPICDDDL